MNYINEHGVRSAVNPYIERKYIQRLVAIPGGGGDTTIMDIPTKGGYITTIERVVWDCQTATTGLAIGFLIGTPLVAAFTIARMVWMHEALSGNHWNEELNLTVDGQHLRLNVENSNAADQVLFAVVTYRYEKRDAEGTTHG